MNIGYRIETEILQKKILSHAANFFSNLLIRSDQRVLGSLTSKYCRQLLIMSMLVVSNNLIRKRTITKSTDERSDFSNGQASKPYRRTGIHLLFKSCDTTSSDAIRPPFQKPFFGWSREHLKTRDWTIKSPNILSRLLESRGNDIPDAQDMEAQQTWFLGPIRETSSYLPVIITDHQS